MKLTPEGWVFLVVLGFITVGAVLRNVNLLIVMAGMMYAPLLLNWRIGIRWLKSFHATRRLPKRTNAKQIASVQWTCENRSFGMVGWNVVINDRIIRLDDSQQSMRETAQADDIPSNEKWWVRWFGEILSRLGKRNQERSRSEIKLAFVRVNVGRSEVQSYRAYFAQRGKYVIGPAALSTTFPFGLIVSRIHFPDSETMYVAPEIGQLHPTWEKRVQSIASGSDTIKRERSLEEDEFYALRPWRSGDSKKHIHWRTSAKFGQPIVKQHDQQNNRDFALMSDLYADEGDESAAARCERALSFTATAILQIRNAVQGQVAIGVCGEETELCHSRTQHGVVVEVMQRLAVAKPGVNPQVVETIFELANSVSRGTPIYVVSSRPRPEILDASFLKTNSADLEAKRVAKRLRGVLPLVRWIEVDSPEFDSMFAISDDNSQAQRLKEFSLKWAE